MTTSGSTSHNLTRNEIIRMALLDCNGVEPEEAVDPQQQTDAELYLNNFIVKVSAKKPLFGVVDYTIPLYDNKEAYTMGPNANKNVTRPMGVSQVRRQDSSGNETPIFMISRSEYMDLPLKSSTGLANQVCYDKQLSAGVLYIWPVATTASTSLSDGSTDQWTNSPAVTGEYYYTGADISAEPTYVFANATELTEGTLGSLSNGEYAYGDNDTLGADTLYVKTSVGDPDAQSSGYIKVLTSTPDTVIVTVNRQLEEFTTSSDTPDFPPEALEMLVDALASRLSIQYAPGRVAILSQKAAMSYIEYMGDDNEDVGLSIRPDTRR